MTFYIHQVPGRLRVKSVFIKHCPIQAEELKLRIKSLSGVRSVDINKRASSVTVLYESQRLAADTILEVIREAGCLSHREAIVHNPKAPPIVAAKKSGELFGKAMFDVFISKGLERSVVSLVRALTVRPVGRN